MRSIRKPCHEDAVIALQEAANALNPYDSILALKISTVAQDMQNGNCNPSQCVFLQSYGVALHNNKAIPDCVVKGVGGALDKVFREMGCDGGEGR